MKTVALCGLTQGTSAMSFIRSKRKAKLRNNSSNHLEGRVAKMPMPLRKAGTLTNEDLWRI